MSYQVFARKYRPQTFDDLLGQDHVVRTLRNAIDQDRLAHAYLFVGPRGTGKTSTARILAKALNCTGGPKVDFDPEESICQEIAEGNCLDVLEIDGASNRGIDEVRELRDTVKFAPSHGRYKIYYIDEVHMLTPQAFNALLKTLEEPPPHVKFIFATTEANKILPTIISRCQRFDLRRIPNKIIAEQLLCIAKNEGVALDSMAAFAVARGAEGGMRDAQSMLDQLVAFCGDKIEEADVLEIFGFTAFETVAGLSSNLVKGDTAAALEQLHAEVENGKDLSKFLGDLISHLRNLLVHKVDPAASAANFAKDIVAVLEEQSALIETNRLIQLIDQFAETDSRMKWAPNKKLHFEIGIIKAIDTLAESTIDEVIQLIDTAVAGGGGSRPAPAQRAVQAAAQDSGPATTAPPPKAGRTSASEREPGASQPIPKSTPAAAPSAAAASPAPPDPAPDPTPAPDPAPAAPAEASGPLSGEALLKQLQIEIDQRRPLASAWLTAGHLIEGKPGQFIIAFSPDDAFACDSLARPNNRSLIEEVVERLAGQKLTLKLEVHDDLDSPAPPDEEVPADPAPASVPVLDGREAGEEAPMEAPAEEAPAVPLGEPESEPASAAGNEDAGEQPNQDEPQPQEEDFHNDPLIKEAIDLFDARIDEQQSQ